MNEWMDSPAQLSHWDGWENILLSLGPELQMLGADKAHPCHSLWKDGI